MPTPTPSPGRRHWLALRVPPVALVALFALAMWWVPSTALAWQPANAWLAGLLAGAGGAFCLGGVAAFRQANTTVNPTAPATSSALVVSGVYRFTRNPMYLGFALGLLAFAVWLSNVSAVLLVPVFMGYLQRFQIRPEEQALRARFGASFDEYCQRVRRWL